MDTIFALSSGSPPAAIAVMRISGPQAGSALELLAAGIPVRRMAALRNLRDGQGVLIDKALIFWFPGPGTATGEDLAELHLHGGRAVIAAAEAALLEMPGMRRAEPGEFTRRAFANGRIDLAEAEGLADLLAAETELQRRAALDVAGGRLSQKVAVWCERLLVLSASVEAVLDFDDEDDVKSLSSEYYNDINIITRDIADALAAPPAEILREGFRVVLAGPPNAGKSTLFNALVDSEAAITSPTAGTTRDVLVRAVAIGGIAFNFIDTAGLRDDSAEEVEAIGIARARSELELADLVLWLGPEGEGPVGAWEVEAQIDRIGHALKTSPDHRVSSLTGEGMPELKSALVAHAMRSMPKPGQTALNKRQRMFLSDALESLQAAVGQSDLLVLAEQLRFARIAFDRLTGRASTEDMLDALFGRFCIGK